MATIHACTVQGLYSIRRAFGFAFLLGVGGGGGGRGGGVGGGGHSKYFFSAKGILYF